MAELTGQSSSVKSGEIVHINALHELHSEYPEGANERVSRVTGVSSSGEFWILHVLDTVRKLEGMSKNVYIAFPIGDEDGYGNKSIDKAQETLAKLKTVRKTLSMGIHWSLTALAGGQRGPTLCPWCSTTSGRSHLATVLHRR